MGTVQARNLEVTLRLRSNSRGSSCVVKQTMIGASILHIWEFCHLKKALASSSWTRLTNLENGRHTDLKTGDQRGGSIEPAFEELIEALVAIQEALGVEIQWPGEYDAEAIRSAKRILKIIQTGEEHTYPATMKFVLPKVGAQRLVQACGDNEWFSLRFDSEGSEARLPDLVLNLGPTRLYLEKACLTLATKRRLAGLDALADNSSVTIEAKIAESGAVSEYTKWLPVDYHVQH